MTNPTTVHSFPDNRFDEACTKCGGFEGESCEQPKPLLPKPVSQEEMEKMLIKIENAWKVGTEEDWCDWIVEHYTSDFPFLLKNIRSLQSRLSQKEEECNAYRKTLERIRERHSNEAIGDGITFYEADKALSLYPL